MNSENFSLLLDPLALRRRRRTTPPVDAPAGPASRAFTFQPSRRPSRCANAWPHER